MSEEIEKGAGFSVEKVDEQPSPYDMGGPNVESVMILTDDDLVSQGPIQWRGIGFKCKKCGALAILHYMKRCGECGAVVDLRSRAATEYIESLQEKYNGK